MKYYLIALLLVIMGAGARTMFQIAYNGAANEKDFAPDKETTFLILLAVWFILMMLCTVALISYKHLPKRPLLASVLTVAVAAPIIYMLITH